MDTRGSEHNLVAAAVVFITGTSGAGKTTLKKCLEELNSEFVRIHDFDELGVPENADSEWRRNATAQWVRYALDNRGKGIHTIIIGQSVASEIEHIVKEHDRSSIAYGFIDIEDATIRERLAARRWSANLIAANVNWAKYLREDVSQQQNHTILEATSILPGQVCDYFRSWIMEQIRRVSK